MPTEAYLGSISLARVSRNPGRIIYGILPPQSTERFQTMKICGDHGIPRCRIDVALGVFVLVVAIGADDCCMLVSFDCVYYCCHIQ